MESKTSNTLNEVDKTVVDMEHITTVLKSINKKWEYISDNYKTELYNDYIDITKIYGDISSTYGDK